MSPLLSIIIPNYNHEAFLRERIDSVFAQDFIDYEIIVLDDCSTDGSRSVVESYGERLDRVVFNETNSGSPFIQWKKGLEIAKGKYIWIAESDDVARPGLLSSLMRLLLEDEKVVLAFCRSELIDRNGSSLGIHKNQTGLGESFSMEGDMFINKYLSRKNVVVNASSAVFRKDAAEGDQGRFSKYRSKGDWVFWTEVARHGRVAFIPDAMNLFRQHGANTTSRQDSDGSGVLEDLQVFEYMKDNGFLSRLDLLSIRVFKTYTVKYRLSADAVTKKVLLDKIGGGPVVSMLALAKCCYRKLSGKES